MEEKLSITVFTDPVCTWCWGAEAVVRAVETHFPGKITMRSAMGGLIKDFRTGPGSDDPEDGPTPDEINTMIGQAMPKMQARSGMPMCGESYHLWSNEHPSSYPMDIAFKAVEAVDPARAELFLYNMKLATNAAARVTSDEAVMADIARESGIDADAMLARIHDGSAERAFWEDMALKEQIEVHVLPSFLLNYKTEKYLIRGYVDYATFCDVIERTSFGELRPQPVEATPAALLAFMAEHPRMADEEVRQAFDLETKDDAAAFVAPLLADGTLVREEIGAGWFVSLADDALAACTEDGSVAAADALAAAAAAMEGITTIEGDLYCDPTTGACTPA